MKRAFLDVIAIGLAACSTAPPAAAAEMTKADAVKILGFMNYKNVVVAAVVNGIGRAEIVTFNGPNVATVIAYVENGNQPKRLEEPFFYDKDLGWFYMVIGNNDTRVQMWTTTGYKEFKPPATSK